MAKKKEKVAKLGKAPVKLGKKVKLGTKAVKLEKVLTDNTDDQLRVIIRGQLEGWQEANSLLNQRKSIAEAEAIKAQS